MKTFDDLKKMPANDLKAIGFKPEVRLPSCFSVSLSAAPSFVRIFCVIGFGLNECTLRPSLLLAHAQLPRIAQQTDEASLGRSAQSFKKLFKGSRRRPGMTRRRNGL